MNGAIRNIISKTKNEQYINKITLVADVISSFILLLFLYTSLSKLADHQVFKNVLTASPLLKPYAGIIALLLPVTELVIVVMLFLPSFRTKGLFASLILLIILTVYLVYMMAFTPNLPCNCGGVIKLLTWPQHIGFNLFFILLSLAGIILYQRAKDLKSSSPP